MFRKTTFLLSILFMASCGTVKKKTTYSETRTVSVEGTGENDISREHNKVSTASHSTKADEIIATAMTYSGVRYRFGGTTRDGMDCSGLLYVSFLEHDIQFPRVSYKMADEGKRIRVNQVRKGDLLFFKTSKSGKRINHVGLVVEVADDDIKFIHSTSSRGVIVSSLREGFWNYSFVKATRIL